MMSASSIQMSIGRIVAIDLIQAGSPFLRHGADSPRGSTASMWAVPFAALIAIHYVISDFMAPFSDRRERELFGDSITQDPRAAPFRLLYHFAGLSQSNTPRTSPSFSMICTIGRRGFM